MDTGNNQTAVPFLFLLWGEGEMIDYVICEFLRDGVIINKGHIDCESFKQKNTSVSRFQRNMPKCFEFAFKFKNMTFIFF